MKPLIYDVIVVGSGMSGLVAAATAANDGARVALVSEGLGSFVYGAGCVADLTEAENLCQHDAITLFMRLTESAGLPYRGNPGEVHLLPTILGTLLPASLVPPTLWDGREQAGQARLVVGINGLSSFDASFVADRLSEQSRLNGAGCVYRARVIDLPRVDGLPHSALSLANQFDRDDGFRDQLGDHLRRVRGEADGILIPAILGQRTTMDDIDRITQAVGCPVSELPTLPPSVAGLRLYHQILGHLRQSGVEVISGHPVQSLMTEDGRCRGVIVENPGRNRPIPARAVVLASGPQSQSLLPGWDGQADDRQRPLRADGSLWAKAVALAGALLCPQAQHGGNGRAIVSGHAAARLVLEQEADHATV